jgi:GDP-fucose protein O-fucosyltransferase
VKPVEPSADPRVLLRTITAMNRVLIFNVFALVFHLVLSQTCDINEIFVIKRICEVDEELKAPTKPSADAIYILYSVNPVEGFNLRRDVYIRMATFLKNLRKVEGYENSRLVLPVFHHLYHWKSHFRQSNMFWNHFFDLDSLKLYEDVIDMWEFFDILLYKHKLPFVDIGEIYNLQHFESMFESGIFVDKFEETACNRNEYDNYHFMEYYNITEKTITCLNFQGSASLLIKVLEKYKDIHHTPGTPRVVLFAVSNWQVSKLNHD